VACEDTIVVVVARAGSKNPLVRADKIKNLIEFDFGGPLHCLMIPADLHFMEAEALVKLADAPKELFKDLI
jgi:diphthine synthase